MNTRKSEKYGRSPIARRFCCGSEKSLRKRTMGFLKRTVSIIKTALMMTWAFAAIWRAIAEGDWGRGAGAFGVLIIAMLPAVRVLGLMNVAGVK